MAVGIGSWRDAKIVLLVCILSLAISNVFSFYVPPTSIPLHSTERISTVANIANVANVALHMTASSLPKRRFLSRFRPKKKSPYGSKSGVVNDFQVLVQPRTNSVANNKNNNKGTSRWNSFKNRIYGTVDSVSSLASRIRRRKENYTLERPLDGYSETIESRFLQVKSGDDSSNSPGQRLLRQYDEITPKQPALSGSQESNSNPFDGFKETIYGTVDGVSGLLSGEPEDIPEPPILAQEFRPLTQPSITTSPEVKAALPNLKSRNPIRRWLAKRTIRKWEEDLRRREEALRREAQVREFKESVYKVVDGVQGGLEAIASVPGKLVETADVTQRAAVQTAEFVGSIPDTVAGAYATVAAIPGQVGKTIDEVSTNVRSGVETTQKFVDDVKAIPGKVQESVETTKNNVDNAVSTVKVLTGLEERKPQPPKTPPPEPPSARDMAWKVAGFVAKNTAKAAWWAGKGAFILSLKGAKLAASAALENIQNKGSKADTDPALKKEVDFALQMAENAIKMAEESNGPPPVEMPSDTDDSTVQEEVALAGKSTSAKD